MHFIEQPSLQIRMKAYVSRFASADEEWPQAWALVEVEPFQWSCTVPVHELVHTVLTRSDDSDLRRLPHEWHGEDLTVEFGPAVLTGTAEEWLTLCRRLIDTAESAENVYELPDTQPWADESFPVLMAAIIVDGEALQESPALSPVDTLAQAGGFETREFVELFGAGWAEWEHAHGGGEVRLEDHLFLWGSPAQLGATVNITERRLHVGTPQAKWSGSAHLGYELSEPITMSRDLSDEEIRAIVVPLLARRRRSFTWCRYCGDRLAPEHRLEPTVCYRCATEWLGVVY